MNGGTITVIDGWVYYTPAAGSTGTDSFTYVIKDGLGGVTTRTVQVGIIPGDAPVQYTLTFEKISGGSRRVVFSGVTGRIYRIQSSESLADEGSWQTRATVQADEDGTFEFTDTLPLPAARFYRAVFP